jgi:hypothetical protein
VIGYLENKPKAEGSKLKVKQAWRFGSQEAGRLARRFYGNFYRTQIFTDIHRFTKAQGSKLKVDLRIELKKAYSSADYADYTDY